MGSLGRSLTFVGIERIFAAQGRGAPPLCLWQVGQKGLDKLVDARRGIHSGPFRSVSLHLDGQRVPRPRNGRYGIRHESVEHARIVLLVAIPDVARVLADVFLDHSLESGS